MRKSFLLVILLLTILTACSTGNIEITPSAPENTPAGAQAVETPDPASPTSAENVQGNASQGNAAPTVMTTIPAPGENTGVVTGIIFSTKMDAPLSQIGVYLGDYMYLTPGPGYMITMTQKGSPNTVADSEGRFAIGNVKPGDYPLLLWTPFSSHVVNKPESTDELVVTVKAGEVTDLGEIQVDWP